MALSTKGARNQGSAWGALLKAHSAEKQRTEKNPSPLIPNEQPISTINKKSSGTPQPNFSPLPDSSLQTNSDPSFVYRLGNLRVALEEEDEDWVRDAESSPIPFSSQVLTDIPLSDFPKQQQLSLESTQLALVSGADSLDRDKPILTGTGASSTASTSPPERAQSTERDGKYADWGAWHLEQLGTLQSFKQNTDSSPNDRNFFAYQLLAEKSDRQSSIAKPTTVNQLEPTKSASINKTEQEFTFGFLLEPTQPEEPQKAKQKKNKEKQKEDSPSCTTPVELNVKVPPAPPSLEVVSQPPQEFRAFNLPRAYLSSDSHDSNLSPPPSPNPNAHRAEQTSSVASKASTANAKSEKEEMTKPKLASASTTSYNIAPLHEKPSPKAEKLQSSSKSKTKAAGAPAAAAAVPEWQSSSLPHAPLGTFANDPVPQFDSATFPALGELRPSGSLSGPYAEAFLGQSLAAQQQPYGLQPEPAEFGLAALNALQEREIDGIVLSFEDWCLRALADLHISSDSKLFAYCKRSLFDSKYSIT